jgi:hypothetical protein
MKHRQSEAASAALGQASQAVDAVVNEAVEQWRSKPFPKGLRALLSTLPQIWPAAGAAAGTFPPELVDRRAYDDAAVRRVYLKALRLVHPDKLTVSENPSQEEIHAKVLAQKVFAVLSEANAESQTSST